MSEITEAESISARYQAASDELNHLRSSLVSLSSETARCTTENRLLEKQAVHFRSAVENVMAEILEEEGSLSSGEMRLEITDYGVMKGGTCRRQKSCLVLSVNIFTYILACPGA